MIKLLAVLIGVFVIGFLIVHDTWMMTITAFGYEITTSVLTFVVVLLAFLYAWHLLKKPLCWLGLCQNWYARRRQSQKESYVSLVLRTLVDRNTDATRRLLKDKNSFFDKKSDESYLLDALFAPTPHVFEHLLHRPGTELAGIRGLLKLATDRGDWAEADRLLDKAVETAPQEPWIREAQWQAQVMQNDWAAALETLDRLLKMGRVSKEEYRLRRAFVLLKLGRVAEAYKLAPTHPAVALAMAAAEPERAETVLTKSWAETPCLDVWRAYRSALQKEKPAKRQKAVERFVRPNPKHRLSLIVAAESAMDSELWGVAKQELEAYLQAYPLTPTVAHLMATVERKGWKHEDVAREWDVRAAAAVEDTGWGCGSCGHQTATWDVRCPKCNAFGALQCK